MCDRCAAPRCGIDTTREPHEENSTKNAKTHTTTKNNNATRMVPTVCACHSLDERWHAASRRPLLLYVHRFSRVQQSRQKIITSVVVHHLRGRRPQHPRCVRPDGRCAWANPTRHVRSFPPCEPDKTIKKETSRRRTHDSLWLCAEVATHLGGGCSRFELRCVGEAVASARGKHRALQHAAVERPGRIAVAVGAAARAAAVVSHLHPSSLRVLRHVATGGPARRSRRERLCVGPGARAPGAACRHRRRVCGCPCARRRCGHGSGRGQGARRFLGGDGGAETRCDSRGPEQRYSGGLCWSRSGGCW